MTPGLDFEDKAEFGGLGASRFRFFHFVQNDTIGFLIVWARVSLDSHTSLKNDRAGLRMLSFGFGEMDINLKV
ncbi:hypothetical protein SDC9_172394 [bioreactor metagenome]|uniref:Uncharacterized protein n=1 Tax=bioreactor metagenome TaxID=1076179 RepID=A0A645GDL0_9ZZZZ